MRSIGFLLAFALLRTAAAKCFEPSNAFPVPLWQDGKRSLKSSFEKIEDRLGKLIAEDAYDAASFSVEVTSNTETLWQSFHTARVVNETRPGTSKVDGSSYYRIASISKVFTTLALIYQHDAGNLSLDDPVSNYIEELNHPDSGKLPWKDITLRTLASQLSGIPREFSISDAINFIPDPTALGLPPASKDGLPKCDEYVDFERPCGRDDMIAQLRQSLPLFAPHQKSTYSNVNFNLIGLVLENVTGISYADYIEEAIFKPLGMKSSTLKTPSDKHAVLPVGDSFWDFPLGVSQPTGGIYSTSSDLSNFLRYILTHFNTLGGSNWLMPQSWSTGIYSFWGMPWEIFRTDKLLQQTKRPVTFTTKSGGLPGYISRILVLEEYGLGITILVGGSETLLAKILEIVSVELVRGADEVIWENVDKTYTGSYLPAKSGLNSSIYLTSSPSKGLTISSFISNGTDVLNVLIPTIEGMFGGDALSSPWHAQLIPTLLFKNETTQQGEIWRMLIVYDRGDEDEQGIWEDFCITDVDMMRYAGLPLNEVVFWHEKGVVELPAWNLKLEAAHRRSQGEILVEQTYL